MQTNKQQELEQLMELLACQACDAIRLGGIFYVYAPRLHPEDAAKVQNQSGPSSTATSARRLTGRNVQPTEPLLRLGAKDGPWEIELKIPQKHIGQVLQAFEREHTDRLDVDFLLRSDPTRKFKGSLSRDKIAGEADPTHDETGEAEPVVLARSASTATTSTADYQLPRELLLSGTEVHAKVRCGKRRWATRCSTACGNSSTRRSCSSSESYRTFFTLSERAQRRSIAAGRGRVRLAPPLLFGELSNVFAGWRLCLASCVQATLAAWMCVLTDPTSYSSSGSDAPVHRKAAEPQPRSIRRAPAAAVVQAAAAGPGGHHLSWTTRWRRPHAPHRLPAGGCPADLETGSSQRTPRTRTVPRADDRARKTQAKSRRTNWFTADLRYIAMQHRRELPGPVKPGERATHAACPPTCVPYMAEGDRWNPSVSTF